MAKCKDCNVYHSEDDHGVCKKKRPDRVVVGDCEPEEVQGRIIPKMHGHIVNGWPVVDGEGDACGDFE